MFFACQFNFQRFNDLLGYRILGTKDVGETVVELIGQREVPSRTRISSMFTPDGRPAGWSHPARR